MSGPQRLASLALGLQATLTFVPGDEGYCFTEDRSAYVPVPDTPERLAVGLHELGHLATHDPDASELTNEAAAWSWAMERGADPSAATARLASYHDCWEVDGSGRCYQCP